MPSYVKHKYKATTLTYTQRSTAEEQLFTQDKGILCTAYAGKEGSAVTTTALKILPLISTFPSAGSSHTQNIAVHIPLLEACIAQRPGLSVIHAACLHTVIDDSLFSQIVR